MVTNMAAMMSVANQEFNQLLNIEQMWRYSVMLAQFLT